MTKAFIQKIFVGGLLTCPLLSYSQTKPNFVFIIADDVSCEDIGCYGNKVIKTPNIDKLAKEGIRFNNAFVTISSCSPSRCSIITGKYPHCTGAAELHAPLPQDQIPFPLLLKQNSYYTAHAGKWHMGPAAYRAFDLYTDNNGYNNGDGGERNWVKFLRERPKEKPFFFWFASHDAHRPWGADTFRITHDPAKMSIPVYLADTPETRRDLASYYNEIGRFDFYIGQVIDELKKQKVLDNTLIIVMSDNGRPFPRCKTRVYDSGMITPFVVYWPKGISRKGSVSERLVSSVDVAPTILQLAGVKVPKDFQGTSLVPVLNDPMTKVRDAVYTEHNWHNYEAYERMMRTEDFLYVMNGRPNLTNCGPADSKMSPAQKSLNKLRDEGKLTPAQADVFLTPRPTEELFDVKKDPDQLVNLASNPIYSKQLRVMRESLKKWQLDTGDTMPDNLTPDWNDRETGKPLNIPKVRGTMPGVQPVKTY